jgi:thiamine pyrophosphate-dependent acetolactate synthase large subunit-like protein
MCIHRLRQEVEQNAELKNQLAALQKTNAMLEQERSMVQEEKRKRVEEENRSRVEEEKRKRVEEEKRSRLEAVGAVEAVVEDKRTTSTSSTSSTSSARQLRHSVSTDMSLAGTYACARVSREVWLVIWHTSVLGMVSMKTIKRNTRHRELKQTIALTKPRH